jgi:hypothetical protein
LTRFGRSLSVVIAILAGLTGCVSSPKPADLDQTVAVYPGNATPSGYDGRARFREIFCSVLARSGEPVSTAMDCQNLLWRLADETAPSSQPAPLPTLGAKLRIIVISGAFADCKKVDTIPYGDEIEHLASQGVSVQAVMVSGRSSSEHNARQLAEAIDATGIVPGDRVLLVGYSKGAVDILQFLVDFPKQAQSVAAVLSVSGPIYGTPLASRADWWYRELFADSFSSMCDPGDGGVIESLLPEKRRQWLDQHPLPLGVAYFSLAAFTTGEHLSRGLLLPWQLLAATDPRNDGQVLIEDAVIPGSTLLGYVNADHWDVAISVERQLPHLSARSSSRRFPRDKLFDAMLLFVSEALDDH